MIVSHLCRWTNTKGLRHRSVFGDSCSISLDKEVSLFIHKDRVDSRGDTPCIYNPEGFAVYSHNFVFSSRSEMFSAPNEHILFVKTLLPLFFFLVLAYFLTLLRGSFFSQMEQLINQPFSVEENTDTARLRDIVVCSWFWNGMFEIVMTCRPSSHSEICLERDQSLTIWTWDLVKRCPYSLCKIRFVRWWQFYVLNMRLCE